MFAIDLTTFSWNNSLQWKHLNKSFDEQFAIFLVFVNNLFSVLDI